MLGSACPYQHRLLFMPLFRPHTIALFCLVPLLSCSLALATELADEDDMIPAPPLRTIPEQVAPEQADTSEAPVWDTIRLLGSDVPVGEFRTLYWSPEQSFQSIDTPVPVLVAHGRNPGPRVCLTAAIHGDELNGIEMVRRLMYQLEPKTMSGTVVGIPIVNLDGFRRGSRYLADRRDLNRHFPGNRHASAADRIAHSLFTAVIRDCQYLVDLHTGSQQRTNLPQIRGNLKDEAIFAFSRQFGGITVLHGVGARGTLRRAANDIGIPAVTMEAGGPHQLEETAVDAGVKSLETLLQNLGIQKSKRFWSSPQPVFYQSDWVRADQGGILMSKVKLGDKVREGQVLGTVVDPVTNTGSAILAPYHGRILGMAVNQVVQTGFAAYHVGVEKAPEEVQEQARETVPMENGEAIPVPVEECGGAIGVSC
jgi:uncharacterized protein